MGSTINQPNCEAPIALPGVDSTGLFHEMDQILYHYLHQTVPANQDFRAFTEFCLHEFYGGRSRFNLGGVCLHPGGIPKLAFPYNYKAPQFTQDFSDTLQGLNGPFALELFCRSKCWCPGESEEEREDAKNLLRLAEKRLMSVIPKGQSSMVSKKRRQRSEPEGLRRSSRKKSTCTLICFLITRIA